MTFSSLQNIFKHIVFALAHLYLAIASACDFPKSLLHVG